MTSPSGHRAPGRPHGRDSFLRTRKSGGGPGDGDSHATPVSAETDRDGGPSGAVSHAIQGRPQDASGDAAPDAAAFHVSSGTGIASPGLPRFTRRTGRLRFFGGPGGSPQHQPPLRSPLLTGQDLIDLGMAPGRRWVNCWPNCARNNWPTKSKPNPPPAPGRADASLDDRRAAAMACLGPICVIRRDSGKNV